MFKNITNTLITNIAIFIISFATQIVISRILGPQQTGVYTMAILYVNIVFTLLSFSLSTMTVYIVGQYSEKKNEAISTLFLMLLFMVFISVSIGVILALLLQNTILKNIPLNVIYLTLFEIPSFYIIAFGQGVLFSEQKIIKFNILSLILKTMIFSITLVLLAKKNVYLPVWAVVISNAVLSLYLIASLKNKLHMAFNRRIAIESIKYGFKTNLSNVITILHYRADVFIINLIMNSYAVGLYTVATSISEKMWLFSSSVSMVLFPKIVNESESDRRIYLTNLVSRLSNTATMGTVLIMEIIAYYLIKILFGDNYLNSVVPFQIILPGIYMIGMSRILSNYLTAIGKPAYSIYSKAMSLLINIILNIILIPRYKLAGAACASLVSYSLSTLYVFIVYSKITKTSIIEIVLIKKSDYKDLKSVI